MLLTGNDVVILRKQLGWKREDFANLIGSSTSAIRRWEGFGEREVEIEIRFLGSLYVMQEVINKHGIERVRRRLDPARGQGLLGLYRLLDMKYGRLVGGDEQDEGGSGSMNKMSLDGMATEPEPEPTDAPG